MLFVVKVAEVDGALTAGVHGYSVGAADSPVLDDETRHQETMDTVVLVRALILITHT